MATTLNILPSEPIKISAALNIAVKLPTPTVLIFPRVLISLLALVSSINAPMPPSKPSLSTFSPTLLRISS